MRTYLTVHLVLAPFAAFLILLGLTTPGTALAAGLVLAAAGCAWRAYKREIKSLEIGSLAIFCVLGLADLIAPDVVGANAAALLLTGLGLTCHITVVLGRPWTADYSRAAFPQVADSPIFHFVNLVLSALWGVLFLAIALARSVEAGPFVTWGIAGFGALVSIFGPRLITRWEIRRRITSVETYRWKAPDFIGRSHDKGVDVAVIGAGVGGLTAAALLADAGLKVVVVEQHSAPGGFCHSFTRKAHHKGNSYDYRFNTGPHDFSGLWPGGPVDQLLRRLGVADRLEWRYLDHTYLMRGLRVDVPRDWRDYARELGRLFPASAAGFETFFADACAIFDGMYSTGIGNGGMPGLPASVDAMLAFPREQKLAFEWLEQPFDAFVARYIHDADAREVLSVLARYIGDGSERLTCRQMMPLFGYYFHGGYYPVGGAGRLPDVMVEAIEQRGGIVRLRTPVTKIAVEHGRAAGVVLTDGTSIPAKAVISNADVKRTFLELLAPGDLPAKFRARIERVHPATSAFMVHLGVDFVPDMKPAVRASGDPDISIEVLSLVDPTAAPPGHATIGLLRLVPDDEAARWFPADGTGDWREWRHSHDYRERKTEFGDLLIKAAEKVIPDLSRHIVYRTDASPVTYARYDWTSGGSIYGMSPTGQPMGAKSPIPGCVVAGSATHGAGVEAAVISGAFAANALVPGLLTREVVPPTRQTARMALAPANAQ